MYTAVVSLYVLLAFSFSFEGMAADRKVASESILWVKVDALGRSMPLTKDNLESILGTPMSMREQSEYITLWRGEPAIVASDLGITDARIKVGASRKFSIATFNILGKCITYEDIKKHYGNLSLYDTPRGHSYMDEMVYRSSQSWGSYYFVFRMIARDCLAAITLSTDNDP